MPSPSKEDNVMRLFLENSPLREWRFREIVQEAKVTRLVANKWLKKAVQQDIVRRIKEKGRFPHYSVGKANPAYLSLKRLHALQELHRSGLIPKLLSLEEAKTIILFGSMAKGDWYKDSDVDIFILGNPSDFKRKLYEQKLHRDIELHVFQDKEELASIRTGLLSNVINGYVIKGDIKDIMP